MLVNLNAVNNVKTWIKNPDNIYIGRQTALLKASKWENPHKISVVGTREKAIELFKQDIRKNSALLNDIEQLRGKNLGCWCLPKPCHGDVLLQLLRENTMSTSQQQQQVEQQQQQQTMDAAKKDLSFATAVAKDSATYEYVEIDATACCDPYNIPKTADICLAINRTFGADPDRNVFGAGRNRVGMFRIETPNIDNYRNVTGLKIDEHSPPIAAVAVRTERIHVKEDGRLQRNNVRSPNDLLLTFKDADRYIFSSVSNEKIVEQIVALGIGKIKKAVQRQWDWKKGEYTGNKFCVLEDVKPEQRNMIPDSLMFNHPVFGPIKMWVHHRHQIRRCSFCGESHAAGCNIRDKIQAMEKERDEKREAEGGIFHTKTYSSSVLRYANQSALVSDVDTMSGATTGNLLNAVEADVKNADAKTLVIVSGSNEKLMQVSLEEYVFSLKVIRQRLSTLAQQKKILLVPPPISTDITPEDQVKGEHFAEHLENVAKEGVLILKNPIPVYDEDQGRHPSPLQTTELIKAIDQRTKFELKTPYILDNATEDVIALPNHYQHVQSLYKYGCGACAGKVRNKWVNICDTCKAEARKDPETLKTAETLMAEIQNRQELENPSIYDHSSEDEWTCNDCGVSFKEKKELSDHLADEHPNTEQSLKRGKNRDGDKKGRRNKGHPERSLQASS